jgi:serine protease Do
MDEFVKVRIVQANGIDLSQFQFDFDLTFAVFFMNADKTIYGRFGSRSDLKDAMRNISIDGFRKAMDAALELHKGYPANKSSLTGKKGSAARFKVPEQYPSLRRYKPTLDYEGKVAQSCMHCHMVGAAERKVFREAREPLPDEVLYPWPVPDAIGLTLDPKEKAKVATVASGSSAATDGFQPGDEILTLEGQPMISIADVQWLLHTAKASTTLKAEVLRNGRTVNLPLTLSEGWRQASDISWRTTTWDLRRMALGGLVLEALPDAKRQAAGLADTALALHIKHVGQYGDHAVGKKAGFKKGDIVVSFDGHSANMTESALIAHVMKNRMPGEQLPVTVLRDGQRVELELPMQ